MLLLFYSYDNLVCRQRLPDLQVAGGYDNFMHNKAAAVNLIT